MPSKMHEPADGTAPRVSDFVLTAISQQSARSLQAAFPRACSPYNAAADDEPLRGTVM